MALIYGIVQGGGGWDHLSIRGGSEPLKAKSALVSRFVGGLDVLVFAAVFVVWFRNCALVEIALLNERTISLSSFFPSSQELFIYSQNSGRGMHVIHVMPHLSPGEDCSLLTPLEPQSRFRDKVLEI